MNERKSWRTDQSADCRSRNTDGPPDGCSGGCFWCLPEPKVPTVKQSIDPRLQLFFIRVPLLLRVREKNPANPKLPAQILIFVCVFIYLFFARPHKHNVFNREKAASSGLWLSRPSEKHSVRLVIEVEEHWLRLSSRVSLLIHHQIFSQNEWTVDQNVPLTAVMNYNDRRHWTRTGGDGIRTLMSRAAERSHALALHRLLCFLQNKMLHRCFLLRICVSVLSLSST